MNKPLNDAKARCHGEGCAKKSICKRFLTIELDGKSTTRYEYCVRAYYPTLLKEDGTCKHFTSDD